MVLSIRPYSANAAPSARGDMPFVGDRGLGGARGPQLTGGDIGAQCPARRMAEAHQPQPVGADRRGGARLTVAEGPHPH
ncbi:hypothetical protein ACIHAA_08565 [Streptomyces sp. NPDC052040]|uniref:hypothetical protein n=1 Tax=Streptomyces sp. NPDC052040 TaxID=3365682 RepID=UPI0037CF3FA1